MATGLYRTEWKGSLQGQYRENVIYWRLNPDPGVNPYLTAQQLVIALDSTFVPLWLAMMPSDYWLSALFARAVGPISGSYASVDKEEMTAIGTLGTSAVAEQLCPCITMIPPMGTKSAGRIFLPAVANTQINLNVPTAGYLTAIGNFMNPAIAGFSVSGGTASIAIYSRKLNVSHEVTGFNLSAAIGYQRKRARAIGA